MEKKDKFNFAAIFSICAVMFSAYVGPGFASGTQTVSYFSNKGWIGVFLGPAIAALLCFVFNLLLFETIESTNPIHTEKPITRFIDQKVCSCFLEHLRKFRLSW